MPKRIHKVGSGVFYCLIAYDRQGNNQTPRTGKDEDSHSQNDNVRDVSERKKKGVRNRDFQNAVGVTIVSIEDLLWHKSMPG